MFKYPFKEILLSSELDLKIQELKQPNSSVFWNEKKILTASDIMRKLVFYFFPNSSAT